MAEAFAATTRKLTADQFVCWCSSECKGHKQSTGQLQMISPSLTTRHWQWAHSGNAMSKPAKSFTMLASQGTVITPMFVSWCQAFRQCNAQAIHHTRKPAANCFPDTCKNGIQHSGNAKWRLAKSVIMSMSQLQIICPILIR